MTAANYFSGFEYPASELLKFLTASDLFTIMLKNGNIINFLPDDDMLFKKWLIDNDVIDIRKEEGWIIT
ncbi:MAG: hypothetical protein EOO20_11965 [Chryseobacterium sp.]|nr:MAG: hypothetical protein EOO20_11965 [Chryseobacterium sp.]